MSHVCSVAVEITDLDAFADACKELGGEYLPEENNWRWYGKWLDDFAAKDAAYKNGIKPEVYGKADAGVAKFAGCDWDVGLYKHPTKAGVFVPVFDTYADGHGLTKLLGKRLETLKTEYAAAVARKTLRHQGWIVKRTVDEKTGRLRLVCQK